MATRVSGTRSIAPQSGGVTSPQGSNNITQSGGGITLASSSTIQLDAKSTIIKSSSTFLSSNPQNVGSIVNPTGDDPVSIDQVLYSTTVQRKLAANYFAGGVGIEKDLSVGGFIYGRIAVANTATTSSNIVIRATNDDDTFYPVFINNRGIGLANGVPLFVDTADSTGDVELGKGLSYNPKLGLLTTERVFVNANINAVSTTTGAFTVTGGVGIGQDVYIGGGVFPAAQNTGTIGRVDYEWADAYLNNIYTRFIGNTNSNVVVSPNNGISNPDNGNGGLLDVFGGIRVRGENPIGTAPVVTNILYVTMDGDDTNDGRAMDPSRACRTISAAVKSPYYQSGTQIRVAPGHYLEDNPILLKPYTSVMGSDIRTTGIEPINKTQDLFHVQSGCYIAFCQFLNGRSGLLPGNYAAGFNRGAYATAFPPLAGDARIDLFHSPYIQNCTNMSGPWLVDGTLFTPNQTVQVPTAVASGSWPANTTTIVVSLNSGTIEIGQAINPGQQNPGFFNARTLILASKPFLQEQVVKYVGNQVAAYGQTPGSKWYNFLYDDSRQAFCFRDVGIIVENVAYDLAFGGNEKSVITGLGYYNGVVSLIPGQEIQTSDAIDYLKTLIQYVIINSPAPDLFNGAGKYKQVINTVLTGGAVCSPSVTTLFGIINKIINNGPDAAPEIYNSTGPDAAYISAEILLQANRKFIQEQTINYINENLVYPKPDISFNKVKCARDTGLVIDSMSIDLLYPTSNYSQTTFSGLQYWSQGSYVRNIAQEITTATSAVKYLRDLSAKIVQNITPATDRLIGFIRYSNVPQDTSNQPATASDVMGIVNNYNDIISIMSGNNTGWTDKIVPNGAPSNLLNVQNAYNSLLANIPYLQAEVNGYITYNFPTFSYNPASYSEDVEYIVRSIAFDLLHGGNRQSVQRGLSYYTVSGTTNVIPNQTTATVGAFTFLAGLMGKMITTPTAVPTTYQTKVKQVLGLPLATPSQSAVLTATIVSTLTNIIANGPTGYQYSPIELTRSTDPNDTHAYDLIQANRKFLIAETLAWIDFNFGTAPFLFDPARVAKCARDTKLIVDAIGMDMLYNSESDSTFAGLQYWNQDLGYTGTIPSEIAATIDAIEYLQNLAAAYTTGGNQTTVNALFGNILSILNSGVAGVTDRIVFGGLPTIDTTTLADVARLQANIGSMQTAVINRITSAFPGLNYNQATCRRDVAHIINSICFDLTNGGNVQSYKSGIYYYTYNDELTTIRGQIPETTAAYEFITDLVPNIVSGTRIPNPYQTVTAQITTGDPGTIAEADVLRDKIYTILKIISGGPNRIEKTPQNLNESNNINVVNAWKLLHANRDFIAAEVVAYINSTLNTKAFIYDQELCYRDTGLLVDAVSQDILLGGNQKSIEAGLAYWNQGFNYVADQVSTTTMAIAYISNISREIIANTTVTSVVGTVAKQVINTYFKYGEDYMPQQAVARNYNIISTIIEKGPQAAPLVYAGGGIAPLTGMNGLDVKLAPRITAVNNLGNKKYLLGLDQPTVGFGNNSTLYIGDTAVYPAQDSEVETLSLELHGNKNTWDSRKVDPIGGMGGSLVDGAVISRRSPINSFVYDAYTQLTQGGVGVKVTNNGYAQLVSVFTIFSSVGVQVDNGGIASIVNSNANFGDICLLAKGYGSRSFSGTVYNPPYKSYPSSPGIEGFDQYYPSGFWPNKGTVQVFVPDTADRPHISLVMEVEPPETFVNVQGFPGFITAQTSFATLDTGTITINNIDTTGIAIGNKIHIRDQYGQQYNTGTNNLAWYANTGTYVTDVNFNSVTLNRPLGSGGGDITNPNYFNLYFCGNAYYTVLSSTTATNPRPTSYNILSATALAYYDIRGVLQTPADQVSSHLSALGFLNSLVDKVIKNQAGTTDSAYTQQFLPTDGRQSQLFIDTGFDNLLNIIGATGSTFKTIVPSRSITKTGTVPAGASGAIALLEANLDYLASAVSNYVASPTGLNFPLSNGSNNTPNDVAKCQRDVKLIIRQLIYDLETGGNYHMVYAGLSYWSRDGTHHIINLDEAVVDPSLFPDGATVNFYQRSYISASGYVFEYVGAGTNYGALPQVGRADPVQKKETVQLDTGKVFFTSTDQNGDFRIGPGLVISQATGVISGRTFTQSLFANMTPFILAIEAG